MARDVQETNYAVGHGRACIVTTHHDTGHIVKTEGSSGLPFRASSYMSLDEGDVPVIEAISL